MIRKNTLTNNEMHTINRSAILDYIRQNGPTSRPLIARELDFSLPMIMRVIDELIEENLVSQTGEKEFSGGRRRPLLELNIKGNAIIGIDLGGTQIYGAAIDLSGAVLVENKFENQLISAEASYDRLKKLVQALIQSDAVSNRKILGLAVGTQGLTDNSTGIVLSDPIQNWKNFPLKQKMEKDFGVPVVIDNDVNLAALGELWFGAGAGNSNIRNMIFITIGNGVGAGIIIDGALYRSSNHLAGEIGYFVPGREFLGAPKTTSGILESKASLATIVEHAHRQFDGSNHPIPTAEDIFEAMLSGKDWAKKLVSEMLDYLAISIANSSAMLDPDLIVLRSGLDQYTDLLIEPILNRIEGLVPIKPVLVSSKLGYKTTVLGAIVEVLYETNNFYSIRKLR